MISRAKIEDSSNEIDSVAKASIIAVVRMTDMYKSNPAYFSDLGDKIDAVNGTVEAQQLNAALDELENLGIGEVQINQSQTTGTDGLIYSKPAERASLVNYILGVLYEAFSTSLVIESDDEDLFIRGNYAVGRLPLDYEGYLT